MFGLDALESAVLLGLIIVAFQLIACAIVYGAYHMYESESEFTFDMPFNVRDER